MKVLKPGREQTGWAHELKCTGNGNGGGGCGATLLVEQADVYKTHVWDYGGGHDTYNTFRCPCGVQTDLSSSVDLPFTPPDKEPTVAAPAAKESAEPPVSSIEKERRR
jgi:hypothetical protein